MGYIVINGAESGLSGMIGANNVDPLDAFCGDNICNAKADAVANTCLMGVPSTVVGKKLLFLIIFGLSALLDYLHLTTFTST